MQRRCRVFRRFTGWKSRIYAVGSTGNGISRLPLGRTPEPGDALEERVHLGDTLRLRHQDHVELLGLLQIRRDDAGRDGDDGNPAQTKGDPQLAQQLPAAGVEVVFIEVLSKDVPKEVEELLALIPKGK